VNAPCELAKSSRVFAFLELVKSVLSSNPHRSPRSRLRAQLFAFEPQGQFRLVGLGIDQLSESLGAHQH
jgi:hypothetical protein